jgi:cellobiose phosphorylase
MSFGHWINDAQGLPCYHYTGDIPWRKNPSQIQEDPYFLLGNDRLTVFTHVSGAYQFITGERSWMKINHKNEFTGHNAAEIQVGDESPELLTGKNSDRAHQANKIFGTGFAQFDYTSKNFTCQRTLSVLPGEAVGKSIPALRIDICVTNNSKSKERFAFRESIGVSHRMLSTQYAPDESLKIRYAQHIAQEERHHVRITTQATSEDAHRLVPLEARAKVDAHAPDVYMSIADSRGCQIITKVDEHGEHMLAAYLDTELAPNESTRMTVFIGLCFEQQNDNPTQHTTMLQRAYDASDTIPYRSQWARRLPCFADEEDADLRREMIWNAYILEAMATYRITFKETYIPQGTVYDYGTGNIAAPRDHLQHLLGVIPHNPELARSCLRFVMNKELSNGCIVYTEQGYGHTSDLMWHTSDQQLYLMTALAEYCRISDDYTFLNEQVPYCYGSANTPGSVFEHIERAYVYFRDEVGLGFHGLPRIMNSDWNDGIFYHRPIAPYFWTATSHMNAAMASVVLQQMADMLREATKRGILEASKTETLIESVQNYRDQITTALMKDMEGRSFSRRAWLTAEEAIGSDSMFLEPQGFLLQIPEFPSERKITLHEEIQARLGGEGVGCRHIEKPQEEEGIMQAPGEGENAGIWYALQGPLIIGSNEVDPDAALNMLKQMGPTNYARHFPNIWVGHWTSSDAINSHFSPLEGEVNSQFRQLQEVPGFCAHPHAWALYAYQRIKETRSSINHLSD